MPKRLVMPALAALATALATALAAAVAPALATAAGKTSCRFDVTVVSAPLTTGAGPVSTVNGTQPRAGTVDGKVCGRAFHGAGRLVLTFTSPGKSTLGGTFFGPLGSIRQAGQSTGVLQPGGTSSLSASGKVTGGTGIYKRATGSFVATGTQAANSQVSTLHITGKLKL